MNRRAHYLLRAAAVAVLVVEALLPVRGASKAPAEADGDVKVQPAAPAASPAPAAPVALN